MSALVSDAEMCQRCGGPNVVWFAPSPLWNLVMRGNDILGEALYGDMVCIRCFVILAEEAGVAGAWRVMVDPEPEGLVKVTPSGRVWDEARSLWVEMCAVGDDGHEVVDAWLREHRKGNLTDHLVEAGFARLIEAEAEAAREQLHAAMAGSEDA